MKRKIGMREKKKSNDKKEEILKIEKTKKMAGSACSTWSYWRV